MVIKLTILVEIREKNLFLAQMTFFDRLLFPVRGSKFIETVWSDKEMIVNHDNGSYLPSFGD